MRPIRSGAPPLNLDCILRGEKSGELPIQVPNFEIVVNLGIAKTLNIEVGPLARPRRQRD